MIVCKVKYRSIFHLESKRIEEDVLITMVNQMVSQISIYYKESHVIKFPY